MAAGDTKIQGTSSLVIDLPVCKVHGANMEPTWVLSAPDGPHAGPMNLAIGAGSEQFCPQSQKG